MMEAWERNFDNQEAMDTGLKLILESVRNLDPAKISKSHREIRALVKDAEEQKNAVVSESEQARQAVENTLEIGAHGEAISEKMAGIMEQLEEISHRLTKIETTPKSKCCAMM